MLKPWIQRWRLAIQLLPLVAVVATLRYTFDAVGWDTAPLSPLYTGLVAGTIFLLGFLLAGTLGDYKESEKLPGDLAASMESIADECLILEAEKPAAAQTCLADVRDLAGAIEDWLRGRRTVDAVLAAVTGLNVHFREFEPLTQPNFIVRLKQEQNSIRRMVIRIDVIRETSFVKAGYAIAELTSLLLLIGLMFTNVGGPSIEVFLVATLAFLLGYMLLLIRDLDNPFDYDGTDKAGVSEVSLRVLVDVRQRLAALSPTPTTHSS